MKPENPPLLSIALVSGVSLAYEILLLQLFSQVYWHHFAFLAISTALLGVGGAGTLVTVLQRRLLSRPDRYYLLFLGAFCLAILTTFPIAQQLPFNPLQMLWLPSQVLWLTALFSLLAIPFLCGAAAIVLMLRCFAARAGHVYGWDLCGAGVGALTIVGLMQYFSVADCLRWLVCGALMATVAGLFAWRSNRRMAASLTCIVLMVLVWRIPESWIAPDSNQFKALAQQLRTPGNEIIAKRPSPQGEVTVTRHAVTPMRYAPGLSLTSTETLPEQLGVFVNGDGAGVLLKYDGNPQSLAFLKQTTAALPYAVLHQRRVRPAVLILNGGSALEAYRAFLYQATAITSVEAHALLGKLPVDYADFSGWDLIASKTELVNRRPRAFIAASEQAFDLILLPLVSAGATGGAQALAPHYTFNREAISGYWQHLTAAGLMAFNLELRLPPRTSLKLVNTAIAALRGQGVTAPEQHLVLIRDWKTLVMLISRSPLAQSDIVAVRRFCSKRAFDTVYFPGMKADEANQYNQVQGTTYYSAIRQLLGPGREDFIAHYKFDLQAITDDQPYLFHHFRWSNVREFAGLFMSGGQALLDWGYPLLVANLGIAVIVSTILILLPLRWTKDKTHKKARFHPGVYFLAIGLAYLFLEIALIEKLALYLANPIYAAAVVLSGFLICSGLGSLWQPFVTKQLLKKPALLFLPLVGVALLTGMLTSHLHGLPALPDALTLSLALLLIAPLAFLLGIPFPMGISALSETDPTAVSWAWAVNGCASVVSPMLATLIALHHGLSWLIYLGIGLYLVAARAGFGFMRNRV